MPLHQTKKREPETPAIPDRLYFKIGDVARICHVETYVLRFWETQFPQLKPNKSGTGQRLYRRNDVELAIRIKQLVHGEGYTIAGARQALGQTAGPSLARRGRRSLPVEAALAEPAIQQNRTPEKVTVAVTQARSELRSLLDLLATPSLEPVAQTQTAAPAPRRRARVTAIDALTGSLFPTE
jgi:DNA-binding transcriptional MerR regulator